MKRWFLLATCSSNAVSASQQPTATGDDDAMAVAGSNATVPKSFQNQQWKIDSFYRGDRAVGGLMPSGDDSSFYALKDSSFLLPLGAISKTAAVSVCITVYTPERYRISNSSGEELDLIRVLRFVSTDL